MDQDRVPTPSPSQGYTGRGHRIPFSDLIQVACLAQMNRVIDVCSGTRSGRVHIGSGQVLHAHADALRGDEALLEMLQWSHGHYEMRSCSDEVTASITKTWEFLVIEAFRRRSLADNHAEEGALGALGSSQAGWEGAIESISLADLMQLVCLAHKDHVVTLWSQERTGRIHARSGQICHAVVDDLEGDGAFFEMFRWNGGAFEASAAVGQQGEEKQSIHKPWEYLLIEAMRVGDEQRIGSEGLEKVQEELKEKYESLQQQVQRMKIAEKIRLAMTGDKEGRALMIRDSNRIVQFAVISNPRITDGEIAAIAYSRSVDEDVLRRIAGSREWMKIYPVRLALTKNPKTPLTIATKLIPTLMANDLKQIAKSKAVPSAVAVAARRQITA